MSSLQDPAPRPLALVLLFTPVMVTWEVAATAMLVFLARVVDVSLGTVRIALVSRGLRKAAPLVAFLEILVWLVAFGQVVGHLDKPLYCLAFAAGYAVGTFLGLVLEERLASGLCAVRVITPDGAQDLMARLTNHHCGVTSLVARGITGQMRVVLTIIRRRDLKRVLQVVRETEPASFVAVSDVRLASQGYFPQTTPSYRRLARWLEKKPARPLPEALTAMAPIATNGYRQPSGTRGRGRRREPP